MTGASDPPLDGPRTARVARSVQLTASAAVAVLGVVAVAGGWVQVSRTTPEETAQIATFVSVVVIGAQVAGAAICIRRPGWTGPLLQLSAVGLLLGAAQHARLSEPVPAVMRWVVGGAAATLAVPAVLLVLRSRTMGPTAGRGRMERWAAAVCAVGAATSALFAILVVLRTDGGHDARPQWWFVRTATEVPVSATITMGLHSVAVAIAALSAEVAVLGAARRTRRAERGIRRPEVITGSVWVAATLTMLSTRWVADDLWVNRHLGLSPWGVAVVLVVPMVALTAFLAAVAWFELVAPRLRRAGAGMVMWEHRTIDADAHVRRVLADPGARALYPAPDHGWVDVDGRPVGAEVEGRALTVFRRAGVEVAAIHHDQQLLAHPEAIELVAVSAGLALERDRVAAQAAADLQRVRRLTVRLVAAPDAARIEVYEAVRRDPDVLLRAIADDLRAGAPLESAAEGLSEVARQVREMSHGLLPPALSTQGLTGALVDALEVPGRRYPSAVEVTAYLAARGDRGARVTEDADALVIALSSPPEDPAVLDRVEVLGGTVSGAELRLPVGG